MLKNTLKFSFLGFFIIFVFFLYLLTLRGNYGNPSIKQIDTNLKEWSQPFESSHERSPYAVLISLNRDKKFDLSQDLADIGAPDVSYYKGKFYSFFPIGLPLLLYPSYALGTRYFGAQLLTYGTIAIFGFIATILVYLISNSIFKISKRLSMLAAIIFAFSTTSWSYSSTIYQHIPTTMFLLAMFYSAWKYGKMNKTAWLWASIVWISYGIMIFMDYPNAVLGLPLMAYFLTKSFTWIKSKAGSKIKIQFSFIIVVTSLLFFSIMGSLLYFNYKQFGSPTKIAQNFDRYERDKYYQLLAKVKAREEKQEVGVVIKRTDSTLDESRIVNGAFILLFDNDKGIFFYSPILLLSILGFTFMFKNKRSEYTLEAILLVTLTITNLFIYASFGDPWGGWAYGPRYLIPSMALLAIPTVYWLQAMKKRFTYIIAALFTLILFIYSSGVALLGVLTTNIIPPKIEAIPLKLRYYNYLQNLSYLTNEKTSDFVFNTYLKNHMNLVQYFFMIWGAVLFYAILLLFIVPLIHKDESVI